MAGVTSTGVERDKELPDGRRHIRYRFDLLDNLSGNHIQYQDHNYAPADTDTDAELLARAARIIPDLIVQEQQQLQIDSRDTETYVLFDDMGGFYVEKTLLWGVWDDQTSLWLEYWLSQENQLDLIHLNPDLGQITNTQIKDLLGVAQADTTDIRAAVQVAVDMTATLDAYQPFYDADGNWVGAP